MRVLRLVCTEGVEGELLEFAKVHYERRFGGYLDTEVLDTLIDLTRVIFRSGAKGRQYLADGILQEGLKERGGGIVIVITSADIYTHGTNYIFGLATHGGGVVSSARIDPSFWDGFSEIFKYRSLGKEYFLRQFGKVLLHEVGHALSLSHCNDPGCVMRYSNSPIELYSKGEEYCKRCWKDLVLNLRGLG
ncbi:MAG: hypothetical protein ACUVQ5_02270 [Candidatus Methanomethylicaceae archaeon]